MRFAALCACVFISGCTQTTDARLRKAIDFLWAQQAEDGGWHSRTYGLLRSGQSLSPFVLEALLQAPPHVHSAPPGAVDRALAFIQRNVNADGAVGLADPMVPDYPNYATALAVQALCRARPAGYERSIARLVSYLRAQQLTERNGWKAQSPPYGGWGIGGNRRTPPYPGHVDLSMTRYVLQALLTAGVPRSDPAFSRARVFVERCQNFDPAHPGDADGGFYFSTVVLDANKAGSDGERYRSYGTTTADGILALLATGCDLKDARVRAAGRWLTKNHIPAGAPGFMGEPYQRWKAGLRFYYASASSEAFRALKVDAKPDVIEFLIREQRTNGAWVNAENLVKEDDPLIATVFAVKTILNSQPLKSRPLARTATTAGHPDP